MYIYLYTYLFYSMIVQIDLVFTNLMCITYYDFFSGAHELPLASGSSTFYNRIASVKK